MKVKVVSPNHPSTLRITLSPHPPHSSHCVLLYLLTPKKAGTSSLDDILVLPGAGEGVTVTVSGYDYQDTTFSAVAVTQAGFSERTPSMQAE